VLLAVMGTPYVGVDGVNIEGSSLRILVAAADEYHRKAVARG